MRYVLLGLGLACSVAALVVFLAAARAGSRSEGAEGTEGPEEPGSG